MDSSTSLVFPVGSIRFETLLDQAARISPELRLRFTSPHPKDFPDDLLHVRPNPPVFGYRSLILDHARSWKHL